MPAISSVAAKTSPLTIIRKKVYPRVTGGTITSDDSYYYHTFTSNDTLKIEYDDISIDYWVAGGGGGGGYRSSPNSFYWESYNGNKLSYVGGSGGGGSTLISGSNINIQPQSGSILIGAGGTSLQSGSACWHNLITSPSMSFGTLGNGATLRC